MFEIYVNITFKSAPLCPKYSLLFMFPYYSVVCSDAVFPNVTVLTLLVLVAFSEYRKLFTSQFSNFSNFLVLPPTCTQILSSGPVL